MVAPLSRDATTRRAPAGLGHPRRVIVLNWKDRRHPEAGGAETFCENVARELAESGADVTVVCGGAPGLPAREERDGYRIRRMGRMLSVYPLALAWLFRHRRTIDAVLDSQNGFPFFSPIAVRRSTPVALLVHHVHQDQFGMYYPEPVAWFGRFLESTATRIVYGRRAICAVSPSTRSEVRRRLRLRGPIHVTPNGVEPPAARFSRSLTPTIACVGRLTTHKRWNLLIEALPDVLHAVPSLMVDIVGTGPDRDALEQLARSLGVDRHVRFHGWVTSEQRDEILGRSWLTVSTSVGEGWGLAVIEAAALGVPAVAYDVPGLRDSVRHEVTGWLAAENAMASELVRAVAVLSDPHVADRVAHACEQWAQSLQWRSTADRIRTIFVSELTRLAETGAHPDMSCVVVLDHVAARRVDPALLGLLDQVNFCPSCVDSVSRPVVVLAATDEGGAASVMDQFGIDVTADVVECRIARPSDLVQWQAGGVPHVHPSLAGAGRCPAGHGADVAHRAVLPDDSTARSA